MKKAIFTALIAGMALVSCGEVATAVENEYSVVECPVTEGFDIYTPMSSIEYEMELVIENLESRPNFSVKIEQPLDDMWEIHGIDGNNCEVVVHYFYGLE